MKSWALLFACLVLCLVPAKVLAEEDTAALRTQLEQQRALIAEQSAQLQAQQQQLDQQAEELDRLIERLDEVERTAAAAVPAAPPPRKVSGEMTSET